MPDHRAFHVAHLFRGLAHGIHDTAVDTLIRGGRRIQGRSPGQFHQSSSGPLASAQAAQLSKPHREQYASPRRAG